jgi:hypothetical protein
MPDKTEVSRVEPRGTDRRVPNLRDKNGMTQGSQNRYNNASNSTREEGNAMSQYNIAAQANYHLAADD